MIKYQNWEFLQSVEKDLQKCSGYTAFHEDNFDCYSNQFSKIILISCTQIENLLKQVCEGAQNISEIRECIVPRFPKITSCRITFPLWEISRIPWADWENKTPAWWGKAYNGIKHNREHEFRHCNLKNTLDAFCALYLATIIYEIVDSPNEDNDKYRVVLPKLAHPQTLKIQGWSPDDQVFWDQSLMAIPFSK